MRGALDPEKLFQTIPGVGPELARRLHDNLHVDTLEGLETAVFEGRAADVPGVGAARLRMLKAALSDMLQRTRRHRSVPPLEPSVALILDVDREYRQRAAAGALRRIAPRRFNPEGKAWLPILHTERKDWHFTVLFSNTARAHQYDKLHDWVVVYFHTPHEAEGQRTVVTETRGVLAGKRVVRGREKACRNYYGG
jgi:putative hydrolase